MAQNKVKLSKSILEMKFMKKTKVRVEEEEDNARGEALYSSEITPEMRQGGNTVFVETTIAHCKNLIDGRLSFQGMNPEIEKLMSNEDVKKIEAAERRKEKEVSDVEMAQGYSTLVDTMGDKFKSKGGKQGRKFKKPAELSW